ncbi:MAG TPA: helix-turn-helix domain-containing protein [Syntrophales bacterium]|nr:helix-turn-helix domain-containing protein [Syntrophales bacterium]
MKNNVRKIREERMISKSELARLAGVTAGTIVRIERDEECRMIAALGFSLFEKEKVFPD